MQLPDQLDVADARLWLKMGALAKRGFDWTMQVGYAYGIGLVRI